MAGRWGSFLQQAVAGVESRLDNILAEGAEEQNPGKRPATPANANVAKTKAKEDISSGGGISRTASTSSRTNDRLQERLARAIAQKNSRATEGGKERPDSLALSSGVPTRTGSPAPGGGVDSQRASLDIPAVSSPVVEKKEEEVVVEKKVEEEDKVTVPTIELPTESKPKENETLLITVQPGTPAGLPNFDGNHEMNGFAIKPDVEVTPRKSTDSAISSLPRDSIDSRRSELPTSSELPPTEQNESTKSASEYEALLQQLQSDFQTSELQRQEEVHGYIERIDALQSKLQYLAKESAEAARVAKGAAPSTGLDKKLAEKDEQIALLMDEGQKLSKKELAHLTTIKKLRAKIQEESRDVAEAKRKQEKAEKDVAIITDRLRRAEASEKKVIEKQKLITQLQNDLKMMKMDNESQEFTISELREQLEDAVAESKQAEAQKAHKALEAEKKRSKDLEDDIANLKIEKNLGNDRAQAQIRELREKMDKDAERARMSELEMKTEQQILEGKLEVMRARAEEVSSGATGDAQVKLLRQIETLQSQYSVASENWQGIEASLLARATTLKKERDEAVKREADIRKRTRELTLKAKRHEEELEDTRSRLPTFQQELTEQKSKLDTLQKRAEAAEKALIDARAVFELEKQSWKSDLQTRLDEERQKWHEEAITTGLGGFNNRADSPVASSRRGLTSEFLGLQNLQLRRASARSINSDAPIPVSGSILGRRTAAQPIGRGSGHGTPQRQDSNISLRENTEIPQTPSIITDHDDRDFFENNPSASPHQTINDMISVSTAGAGPSVQLVERMSSAVRKLESEKVATKEDLARLAKQRDEARKEIIGLMREVEEKRVLETKVKELEGEVGGLRERYETTLEMLGEKSELVEELKGDVSDLKDMYRELVERTVR